MTPKMILPLAYSASRARTARSGRRGDVGSSAYILCFRAAAPLAIELAIGLDEAARRGTPA